MRHDSYAQHIRRQLQQLILLRETGPKSAAWHMARTRMIWRLHDEIQHEITAAGVALAPENELDSTRATESATQPK